MRLTDGSRQSVKSFESEFEIEADEWDNSQNTIDTDSVLEDAWCELCPEQELARLQCEQERKDKKQSGRT